MKLLWFSHFVPFPPKGGVYQRSFNLIRYMSRSYEVFLIAFNLRRESEERLVSCAGELRKYCENVEFWELPLQWRSGRWWAELAVSPLFRAPFGCRAFWSERLAACWQKTLREHGGALLHVDSPDLALFMAAAKSFRKVLNHHNCESAMADRRAQVERNLLKKSYLLNQARKLADLERQVCHHFDVNTVVSETDGQLLRARNPKAHIHIVENGTDPSYFEPSSVPEEPASLIFASSMDWYPNISAIRFFVHEIWPLVKQQRPDAVLYLAGQSPPAWLVRWVERDPHIVLVADPADVRPWVARAAVFICPIVDGGGTRLKILDALAMGKAVVSTSIGCEGLRVKHGENILVADAPRDLACQVLRVLEDHSLRHRLGVAGRTLVEKEYSWERIAGQLEQAYRCATHRGPCERPAARVEVEA